MDINDIINEIVGEISIILEAPHHDIQAEQPIDDKILQSYEFLSNQGFNKDIITAEEIKAVKRKWKNLGL